MTNKAEQVERWIGIPVAPLFAQRRRVRSEALKALEVSGKELGVDKYAFRIGDYTLNYINPLMHFLDYRVLNVEQIIKIQIEQLLKVKQDRDPVVVLDVGGMVGYSWSKLALTFRDKIRASKLALVVSNLAYNPQDHLEQELRYMSYDPNGRKILSDASSLVNYIVADPTKLRKTALALPDGRAIPLRGNTDIVHEHLATKFWSSIPELEMVQLASLLSPHGTYYIEPGQYVSSHYAKNQSADELRMVEYRRLGIVMALDEMVRRYNLHYGVEQVGDNAHILQKENAPFLQTRRVSL